MYLRHRLQIFLIILAGIISIPFPADAQNRPTNQPLPQPTVRLYNISGTVRDDRNQTVEGVQVNLQQAGGQNFNTTFTRGNGEFEFSGLPNGSYTVEVKLKDFEPAELKVDIYNSSQNGVSFFLQKPLTPSGPRQSSSVSAHELSVPRKAHDEFEKGIALLYSKADYRGAISQFGRAIKDFGTFYEAYNLVGTAYLKLGDTVAAEEALRKSIELSSERYAEPMFGLASLLNNKDNYSQAETIARKAIALNAASPQGHTELARALLGLKKPLDAGKSAIEARDLNPDNPQIYLIMANIHIQMRDQKALLEDLDSYLKLSPTGPEAEQARKTRDQLQASVDHAQERKSQQEIQ